VKQTLLDKEAQGSGKEEEKKNKQGYIYKINQK